MKRITALLLLLSFALSVPVAFADEGMWTFDNPPLKQWKERYNFEPTKEWLDNVRLASPKVNNSSAGFVSPNGLIATNLHVAAGYIERVSSKERDLLKTGFYAKTQADEIKIPDASAAVLVSFDNVTDRVHNASKAGKSDAETAAKRSAEISAIEKDCTATSGGLNCRSSRSIAAANIGSIRTRSSATFALVMAPEEQAAFFGGDYDNFAIRGTISIERFEPEGIVKLNRDDQGELSGVVVKLPAGMKAKNYRQNFRRAIAEAMLGRGVIVGEGITEQDALLVVARKMEEHDTDLFPLDVAGISVINADGDGNLEKLGAFFKEIGIPAFAFFDRKKRTEEEITALQGTYTIAKEITQKGAEMLMAEETPLDRQWQFLELLRNEDSEGRFGIPVARPADDAVRALAVKALKGLKGEGGAARLLDLCAVGQLPPTITGFLGEIYQRYPKPKRKLAAADEAPADDPAAEPEEAAFAAGD